MDQNLSLEVVATRIRDRLKQNASEGGARWRTPVGDLFVKRGPEALEDGCDGCLKFTSDDCLFVAHGYGVHRPLLDGLFSAPSEEVCLLQQLGTFLTTDDPSDPAYGKGISYAIPSHRLADACGTSFVRVQIEPGGSSDIHSHCGDELLFVRDGSVDLLLRGCGLRTRLNKWDYIHFYAEQEHCVFNSTKEWVDLLVLRMRTSGLRFELFHGLRAKQPKPRIVSRATRELLATVAPYPIAGDRLDSRSTPDPPEQIADRFSLSRLLRLLCSPDYREDGFALTLDQLATRGAEHEFNRARFHRLHHSMAPVTPSDLLKLAAIYEVEPVLFYEYLFPVVRNAVAVRNLSDPQLPSRGLSDMRAVPPEYLPGSNATYLVPCRRLADTEVTVAALTLPPGGFTPETRHPGYEILLPLEGQVALKFGHTVTNVDARHTAFAHFRSTQRHYLENPGDEPARIVIIRTYR